MLRYWTINTEKLSGGSTWRIDINQAKSEAQATQFMTHILTVQSMRGVAKLRAESCQRPHSTAVRTWVGLTPLLSPLGIYSMTGETSPKTAQV